MKSTKLIPEWEEKKHFALAMCFACRMILGGKISFIISMVLICGKDFLIGVATVVATETKIKKFVSGANTKLPNLVRRAT